MKIIYILLLIFFAVPYSNSQNLTNKNLNCQELQTEFEKIIKTINLADSILIDPGTANTLQFNTGITSVYKNFGLKVMYWSIDKNGVSRPYNITQYLIGSDQSLNVTIQLKDFNPYSTERYFLSVFLRGDSTCKKLQETLIKKIPLHTVDLTNTDSVLTLRYNFYMNGWLKRHSDYFIYGSYNKEIDYKNESKTITFLRKQKAFKLTTETDTEIISEIGLQARYLKDQDELTLHLFTFKRKGAYDQKLNEEAEKAISIITQKEQEILKGQGSSGKKNILEIYVFTRDGEIYKVQYKKYTQGRSSKELLTSGFCFV